MNRILKILTTVGVAAAALTSCDTLTKYGLNPFEATTPVSATVVSAGSVRYEAGMNMNKKSKKWSTVESLTEGYSQKIKVQTADGRVFSYSLSLQSEDGGVSVGDTGTAKIGVTSGTLLGFEPA